MDVAQWLERQTLSRANPVLMVRCRTLSKFIPSTLLQFTRCVNEYMATEDGGGFCTNNLRASLVT